MWLWDLPGPHARSAELLSPETSSPSTAPTKDLTQELTGSCLAWSRPWTPAELESPLDAGATRPFGATKAKPLCAPTCFPPTRASPPPVGPPSHVSPTCSATPPQAPQSRAHRGSTAQAPAQQMWAHKWQPWVQAPKPWHVSLTRQGLRLFVIRVCECPGFRRSACEVQSRPTDRPFCAHSSCLPSDVLQESTRAQEWGVLCARGSGGSLAHRSFLCTRSC